MSETLRGKGRVCFITWESPWPGYSGAALRKQGLLKEISKGFDVHLILFLKDYLDVFQKKECNKYAEKVTEVIVKQPKVQIFLSSIIKQLPYHSAAVLLAAEKNRDKLSGIEDYTSVFYCAGSYLTILSRILSGNNKWIVDQFDSEYEYWRIRAREYSNPIKKLLSHINKRIINYSYERLYEGVTQVVCVSKEDKEIVKRILPNKRICVIENGIDCDYFRPSRETIEDTTRNTTRKILFTGTSNERNVRALKAFVKDVFFHLEKEVGKVELLVAGSFDKKAQKIFRKYKYVSFTGKVADIRPYYNEADVFINPFKESYGSKMKLAQALSMGICIVTTESGARGFAIEDGKTALIADSDEELLSRLILALNSKAIRDEIGRRGRKFAEKYIDWSALGYKLRDILISVEKENVT